MVTAASERITRTTCWRVDEARSEIRLLGHHGEMPWVNGVLKGVSGELALDCERPVGSTFELAIDAAGLYIGDPFLNTKLRASDLLGAEGRERRLSGRITAELQDGQYEAEVQHTLARIGCPLVMAVSLSRWRAVGLAKGASPSASRLNVSASQLVDRGPASPPASAGSRPGARWVEQICLELEATSL